MVHVREGGVVAVNVEGDGEQLRHDAVVGDQGGEAGVDFHETLKPRYHLKYVFLTTTAYFYLIAILQPDDDVVSDSKRMESVGHAD